MKRAERYGLRVAPTFDEAVLKKPAKISLPPRPKTQFWDSPLYQSLYSMQQQVETQQELDARRAQLQALVGRVAREHGVAAGEVRGMLGAAVRAGYLGGDVGPDGGGGGGGGRVRRATPATGAAGPILEVPLGPPGPDGDRPPRGPAGGPGGGAIGAEPLAEPEVFRIDTPPARRRMPREDTPPRQAGPMAELARFARRQFEPMRFEPRPNAPPDQAPLDPAGYRPGRASNWRADARAEAAAAPAPAWRGLGIGVRQPLAPAALGRPGSVPAGGPEPETEPGAGGAARPPFAFPAPPNWRPAPVVPGERLLPGGGRAAVQGIAAAAAENHQQRDAGMRAEVLRNMARQAAQWEEARARRQQVAGMFGPYGRPGAALAPALTPVASLVPGARPEAQFMGQMAVNAGAPAGLNPAGDQMATEAAPAVRRAASGDAAPAGRRRRTDGPAAAATATAPAPAAPPPRGRSASAHPSDADTERSRSRGPRARMQSARPSDADSERGSRPPRARSAVSATSYAGSDATSARTPYSPSGPLTRASSASREPSARGRRPPTADEILDGLIAERQRAKAAERRAVGDRSRTPTPANAAAAASRSRTARLVSAAASSSGRPLAIEGGALPPGPAVARALQEYPDLPIRVSGEMAEAVNRVARRRARSAPRSGQLALPPPPLDESGGAPIQPNAEALPEPAPKARRLRSKTPASLLTATPSERAARRARASSSSAAPYRVARGVQGTRGP